MLYFIPAWYQQNSFNEHEQIWYVRRMHSEFDDTVKQIQLFNRNSTAQYCIMLLSYAPNFRHFLHRQGVFHAPYWSAFDAIQEVRTKRIFVMSYRDLAWPEHTEFIYTPFAIVAYVNGEKYAQIEYGEDGNPILVDMYEGGMIRRRNIYDDRGFVSSTILYENGQQIYQDYLTEKGEFKFRHFFSDGHVDIHSEQADFVIIYNQKEYECTLTKGRYESLEELLSEIVRAYVQHTDDRDIFCEAMDDRHSRMLYEILKGRNNILSFYSDRYDIAEHSESYEIIMNASYIIADSELNVKKIKHKLQGDIKNITDITPYDTRVDIGISDHLYVKNILMPVDGLDISRLKNAIVILAGYMEQNETARVRFFTRQAEANRINELYDIAVNALVEAGYNPGLARENNNIAENDMDNENVKQKFFVDQCVSELEVSKCMREQRLLLELRNQSELYLQVMCVSMGIPQIISTFSQFVEPGKNGIHIESLDQLNSSIDTYLNNLKKWNAAHIAAYEIGKKYTTEVLLDKWREVLDTIG